MSKNNNKWIKIKDSYPEDGEEVEIEDSVGKIGKASHYNKIMNSGLWSSWMGSTKDMNIRDFSRYCKMAKL